MSDATIGPVLLAASFVVWVAAVIIVGRLIEKRLGRDLTTIEILAVAICFPYSAVVLLLLPEKPSNPISHGAGK